MEALAWVVNLLVLQRVFPFDDELLINSTGQVYWREDGVIGWAFISDDEVEKLRKAVEAYHDSR